MESKGFQNIAHGLAVTLRHAVQSQPNPNPLLLRKRWCNVADLLVYATDELRQLRDRVAELEESNSAPAIDIRTGDMPVTTHAELADLLAAVGLRSWLRHSPKEPAPAEPKPAREGIPIKITSTSLSPNGITITGTLPDGCELTMPSDKHYSIAASIEPAEPKPDRACPVCGVTRPALELWKHTSSAHTPNERREAAGLEPIKPTLCRNRVMHKGKVSRCSLERGHISGCQPEPEPEPTEDEPTELHTAQRYEGGSLGCSCGHRYRARTSAYMLAQEQHEHLRKSWGC